MARSVLAAALLAGALGLAPYQCASEPDDPLRQEESAPEALWGLAERFRADGDADARRRTLEHLVSQYPSSRYAERARLVLSGREVAPGP